MTAPKALTCRVQGGELYYEENKGTATILGFTGNTGRLTVPGQIAGLPVTGIGKKAFFDCRYLQVLRLPDTLTKIDNWAFAHCPRLERVELFRGQISLGKDLFIGSDRLWEVCLLSEETDIGELLAAAAIKMDTSLLFTVEEAGTPEWLQKWDARMLVILRSDDNEGYEKQVLAGEEDYERTDQVRYRNLRRREKVRLAFIRLLHPVGLSQAIRTELEGYLRAHTRGCRTEETWEVLLEEAAEREPWYRLFVGLGCVTRENFDAILTDIGEAHTEMKAYLMRYQQEQLGMQDFFDSLSL